MMDPTQRLIFFCHHQHRCRITRNCNHLAVFCIPLAVQRLLGQLEEVVEHEFPGGRDEFGDEHVRAAVQMAICTAAACVRCCISRPSICCGASTVSTARLVIFCPTVTISHSAESGACV